MTKAASKIQSAWRWFWFMQIGPRIRKARFNKAATTVQKYLKGYYAKKHTYKNLSKVKIDNCHDFFMRLKKEREYQASLVIRYHCKKYFLRRKAAKEAAIAKKKAAAAKKAEQEAARRKKYGYGAPPKKKKAAPKPKPLAATKTLNETQLMTQSVNNDELEQTQAILVEGEEQEQRDSQNEDPDGLQDKDDVETQAGADDLNDR